MKKSILLVLFLLVVMPVRVYAESCDSNCANTDEQCFARKLTECNKDLEMIKAAKQPHVETLRKLESNIAAFERQLNSIAQDLIVKAKAIAEEETQLVSITKLVDHRISALYKRSQTYNPLLPFLTSTNVGSVLRLFTYQQKLIDKDKQAIAQAALFIQNLQNRKKELESSQANITSLKSELAIRAASVKKLVDEATAYENKLSNVIATLSAAQKAFLASKLSGLGIPLYAISGGGCSSDIGKSPGFSGGFGFFTYGVPNRVGLNQYGAWGRAKAGQDYETILRAYYNFDSIDGADTGTQIQVQGYGNYSLDDYVKRVYEVPDSWADNDLAALKAQAIAVRSYVMAYTNNGQGSICTTQQCQVFKPDPKGGNWESAVNATAGKVMKQGGQPIKAFFSSTHGGYVFSTGDLSGWSSTSYTKRAVDANGSINSFADLQSRAYDKDSPWFYCDWGSRSQYNHTAWLKPEELADIVNVLLLAKTDSSAQAHLVQTDKPNPDGTDTWDAGTVRSKLGSSAYNSISGVSIGADFGTGRTTQVTVSGDGKSNSFSGDEFKTYFNLRAPANIQIVGPLFNVERS